MIFFFLKQVASCRADGEAAQEKHTAMEKASCGGHRTAVRLFLSQVLLPLVEDKLFCGLCSVLGLLPTDKVQRPPGHGMSPAQAAGRDARSPIHQC